MVKETGWTGGFADSTVNDLPEKQENRRVRANRLNVDFLVSVTAKGSLIQGFTLALNMSWSGMLIATNYPLNFQDHVHLEFALPRGDIPVSIDARVVHVQEAKIPDEVTFATKPELARRMLQRAFDSNVPASWVVADEVYGSDSKTRRLLEKQGIGYVVTVACNQHLFLNGVRDRVDEHIKDLPTSAWKKLSCGDGTKGKRYYHWAYQEFGSLTDEGMQSGLLVRRSLTDPDELAYFFTSSPVGTTKQKLVTVAGSRWAIEECFEQAKQETGLDEYEVRSWHSWYRHITLSMFAHSMLVVIRHKANRSFKKMHGIFGSRAVGEHTYSLGTIFVFNSFEFLSTLVQGFIPGDSLPLGCTAFANIF